MTDPVFLDSATPRFGLPLLFAGQAQKEFHVNEAHVLADSLLHCAIEGESASPPPSPMNGDCWLVAANAGGGWAGQSGKLACRQAGNWIFIAPRDGIRLYNRATGQEMRYANGWHAPARPAPPTGGTVVDAEARSAIVNLVAALAQAGILPAV